MNEWSTYIREDGSLCKTANRRERDRRRFFWERRGGGNRNRERRWEGRKELEELTCAEGIFFTCGDAVYE